MFGKKKVVVEEVGMDEFFENATPKEEKKEEKSEKKTRLLGAVAGVGLITLGLVKAFAQKNDDSDEDEDDSDDSTDDDDEDSDDSEDED